MAQIGLKYLICAPVTEENNEVIYSDGMVMLYQMTSRQLQVLL